MTMTPPRSLALSIAAALALTGCQQLPPDAPAAPEPVTESAAESTAAPTRPDPSEAETTGAEIGAWGIDLEQMDPATDAGADFAEYVNGAWYETFEIPPDRARFGIFDALRERSTEQVREIIDEVSEGNPGDENARKVADYYNTWMDVEALNEKGAEPLDPYLAEIEAIEDLDGLMNAFAELHLPAPFAVGIIPDPADTTRYTIFASQAGLGLPDREYYLSDDERFVEFRAAYRDYMIRIQELAGIDDAAARADAILALETELARLHWPREETRDIQKIYNPMPPAALAETAPKIDWARVLEARGLASAETIIVAQPDVMTASGELVESTDLETWKDYLALHFISDHASLLSEDFDHARFEFFSQTLNGIEEQRERWKRGSDRVNANLGEAVGRIYVDKHFPPRAREEMDALIENLRVAFEERLVENDWMDAETSEAALAKLATFEPRIGYPDQWIDYGPLEIVAGDLLGNELRVAEFQWQRSVDRLDGPVVRDEWSYPPQTVNASYNALLNQITFPAGILQPPFFDPDADPAVNYGAIGAVIGHEMGHGFDDQGRRFDAQGRIRDWWTEAADQAFQQRADRLGAQFDQYEPIEGMTINGSLTMGENIGDLGGLEMAWSAYQRHVAKHGEPPVLDGFTGPQRFFMSWAQVWRAKYRDDALRQQLLTDPHSPPRYRINGVVRNIDAWYDAFDVSEEDALYLSDEERVSIW